MAVIGFDLGGTKLSGAIFRNDGKILLKETVLLNKKEGKEVFDLIKYLLKKLESKSSENIEAMGIAVPGISYLKTGRVWAPNISGWENYPLYDEIRSITKSKMGICIDSDRACCILGEAWQGAAKDCDDAIFLAVGTGIGAGIMIKGEILRGSNDIAGAIGWLALERPFQDKFIHCGCFEYKASGEGIVKVTKDFLQLDKNYNGELRKKEINKITADNVFNAFKLKDPLAEKVLRQAVEFWGMTIANLVSLFNPEKIIIGGGVFGPAIQFLEDILTEAKKWAQPISIKRVKVEGSKLGGDAGLYGAGYLAIKKLLNDEKIK